MRNRVFSKNSRSFWGWFLRESSTLPRFQLGNLLEAGGFAIKPALKTSSNSHSDSSTPANLRGRASELRYALTVEDLRPLSSRQEIKNSSAKVLEKG